MELLVIIALIVTLCFFEKFEGKADKWLDHVDATREDIDSFKTHLAFYGFAYWMGFIAFLCAVTLTQLLADASAGHDVFYAFAQGIILAITIICCSKAAKVYYRCAEISEKSFREYIASK